MWLPMVTSLLLTKRIYDHSQSATTTSAPSYLRGLPHSRLVYYIRGDKEFQGEPERVYGANWAKTGSKWASNPHIREGRGQIDQKSANTVGYDPEDGVQRAPNLRILLLLPRIDFPVCLYFFCNMPSDCVT